MMVSVTCENRDKLAIVTSNYSDIFRPHITYIRGYKCAADPFSLAPVIQYHTKQQGVNILFSIISSCKVRTIIKQWIIDLYERFFWK